MFSQKIQDSLAQVLAKLNLPVEKILVEHPALLDHGDYSTNVALSCAKTLGKSPRVVAVEILKTWQEMGLPRFVEKAEIAGPGFLNIWLKIESLVRETETVLETEYGRSRIGEGKTVVIDYSAPNIAKPFGIGHLRSTNIGQALYNIYKTLGWQTIGDNHLGDWGTQFGKLIYMIRRCPKDQVLTIAELEKLYVQFHKEAETKPEMEEEARALFKALEEGEREARAIWQKCIDLSLAEFNRIYDLLRVKIDFAYGESFYQDKMGEVLADAKEQGLLKESRGAQIVEIPGEEVPAMLIKSDGATTYLLRDLATIKFRKQIWQPDLYLYEVGVDQSLHFRQVFAVAAMLGYGTPEQFVHIAHGLIRWATGKFSTRKGLTIHLEEVLIEAIARARKLIATAGVAKDLPEAEKDRIARAIGIGGIKYNDLKQNPRTDIIFDWDQILTLSGNSGPYLQYTYARTQSVLRKASVNRESLTVNRQSNNNLTPEEIILLRTIYKYSEAILEASKTYSPNYICAYLYDLAQKFNLFYDKHKVIGSASESARLLLTAAVGQVLKNGLTLLGIEALARM